MNTKQLIEAALLGAVTGGAVGAISGEDIIETATEGAMISVGVEFVSDLLDDVF